MYNYGNTIIYKNSTRKKKLNFLHNFTLAVFKSDEP